MRDLVRLAHTITGSNQVAEDVVHDAYLRWCDRPDLTNPGGYLRTIVVDLARDVLRRRQVAGRIRYEQPVHLSEPELDETWAILHLGAVSSIDGVTAVRTLRCFPSVETGAGSSAAIGTDDVKVIWIQAARTPPG